MAVIFGDQNPPFFDDFLFDNPGESDFILAGLGNDTIILLEDFLLGLVDSALGQSGDDTFVIFDRIGNNLIDGGTGNDTVDYSSINESIVLNAQGVIEKASGGIDFLSTVERIIGSSAAGVVNTIDGTGSSASFDVNLSANTLVVNIPGNPLEFEVVNFDNVRGTDSDDTIVGNANDNYIYGSLGDDTIDGGSNGFDTVDYSDLNVEITLKAEGEILKGDVGTDQLLGNPAPLTPSIDRIIAPSGLRNAIDGRTSFPSIIPFQSDLSIFIPIPSPTTFDVDLADEFLEVSVLSQPFQVTNFVDVVGTANNDIIEGDDTIDDTIINGIIIDNLSNVLFGQQGNDTLRGVDETAANPGASELDILFGGTGNDLFLLGDDFAGDYYLSDNIFADPFGDDDFALIFDFETSVDEFNLSGANPYVFDVLFDSRSFEILGIDIYADFGFATNVVDSQDDLIARLLFQEQPLNLATPLPEFDFTLSTFNVDTVESVSISDDLLTAGLANDLTTIPEDDSFLDLVRVDPSIPTSDPIDPIFFPTPTPTPFPTPTPIPFPIPEPIPNLIDTIDEAVELALNASSQFDNFQFDNVNSQTFTFDNLPDGLSSIFTDSTLGLA